MTSVRYLAACGALLVGLLARCSSEDHTGHRSNASPREGVEESTTHPSAADDAVHRAHQPEGYAAVEISADRVQKFGIRTEPAARVALQRQVRTVGIVRTDETRESHVHVKWMGWIEEFFVSYVGQLVKRGDPLFSVYSPELVTAQQELLVAQMRLQAANRSERPQERESALALLDAARTKLRLFDISASAIEAIEQKGEVLRTLTVRAPRTGTVIEKHVLPGMYIEPEMDLYVIADLSQVWVMADLYEYEAPFVRVGQDVTFSPVGVEQTPAQLPAKVVFIDPSVDMETRTVKVRLELPNLEGRLRPGAYGTVRFSIELAPSISVPANAVIDTGTRQILFVETAPGRFEPRAVRLGAQAGARVQVVEGVAEGEQVVTRAQFMLDSESRLRASAEAGGAPAHGAH